jgi:hypothetical protein
MTGLVPVISIQLARLCHSYRDRRVKPGDDAFDCSRDAAAPESSSRGKNFSALRTDLRQRMPVVVAGTLTIRALSHDVRKKKKG